jgi:hypothetical protein
VETFADRVKTARKSLLSQIDGALQDALDENATLAKRQLEQAKRTQASQSVLAEAERMLGEAAQKAKCGPTQAERSRAVAAFAHENLTRYVPSVGKSRQKPAKPQALWTASDWKKMAAAARKRIRRAAR